MKLIVFKALDLLASVCGIAAVLLLVLPDIDVPIGGGRFIRLAGPDNPLLVCLAALAIMRLAFSDQRPWLLLRLESGYRAFGSKRAEVVLLISGVWLGTMLFYYQPPGIVGDGLCYYAYLRSVALQGDLDFTDEFRDYTYGNPDLPDYRLKTPNGMVGNPYSIGPAILWSPFFLVGHLIARATGVPLDGYSSPYVTAVTIGSQVYALLGLLFTLWTVRIVAPDAPHVSAALGLWFCSPLVEYFSRSASMSHAHSVFAVSLFLYLYIRSEGKRGPLGWMALGGAGGIVFLVRWQDATFCLLPVIDLFRGKRLRDAMADGYLYAASFLLIALPQLFVFKAIYGGWITVPQGRDFVGVWPRYAWQVLFSSNHGLITWQHPVFVLCLGGLLWGAWRGLAAHRLLLAGFLLQLYVNASIAQWWAGHSFGGRRFLGCFALFAVGLATMMKSKALQGRRGHVVLFALCVLNYLLWQAWKGGLLAPAGVVSTSEFLAAAWSSARSMGAKTAGIIVAVGFLVLGRGGDDAARRRERPVPIERAGVAG